MTTSSSTPSRLPTPPSTLSSGDIVIARLLAASLSKSVDLGYWPTGEKVQIGDVFRFPNDLGGEIGLVVGLGENFGSQFLCLYWRKNNVKASDAPSATGWSAIDTSEGGTFLCRYSDL